ncbi:amino acid permease, partial [Acinetobacter baumannii]|uniref:amino acid permease n=1 Tax=Acinetobacter baumannii TaxID=470 RepID=UPI000AAE00F7
VDALACIIAVTSLAKDSPEKSPYVVLFTLVGLPIAAGLINFVVSASALSSANSGIFATSRLLYGLALDNGEPKSFSQISNLSLINI